MLRAAVLAAFVLDAATTLLALAAGHVETNALVAGLTPAVYVGATILRGGVALALVGLATRAAPPVRRAVVAGLAGLIAVKLMATASNAALLVQGDALVTPRAALALGVACAIAALASACRGR